MKIVESPESFNWVLKIKSQISDSKQKKLITFNGKSAEIGNFRDFFNISKISSKIPELKSIIDSKAKLRYQLSATFQP